jgi:hypothetical protein
MTTKFIRVFSVFPGVGKTHFYNQNKENTRDSDSSTFDKSEFPQNYIAHIKELLEDESIEHILVSSHKVVRDALVEAGINFVLIKPQHNLKQEYLRRYAQRNSPQTFIDLLDRMWDEWLYEIDGENGRYSKYTLSGENMYLNDVFESWTKDPNKVTHYQGD